MITRIQYSSDDGRRTAIVQRVDERHVPPLGVSWWLTRRLGGIDQHLDVPYTSRKAADRAARCWIAGRAAKSAQKDGRDTR